MVSDSKFICSRIEGFRNLDPEERLSRIAKAVDLSDDAVVSLKGVDSLPVSLANGMIENVIGKFEMPLGIATNFIVNGKDYLVPMVVEEPSVVAAASYMAKLARGCGGFKATAMMPIMRAQIQILGVADPHSAQAQLLSVADNLIALANSKDTVLIGLGGGCKEIEVHVFEDTPIGAMVVLHILVDVRDAMGANTVNSMAEIIAPKVEEITGGTVRLRILSNLADRRLVSASVRLTPRALSTKSLDGADVARRIVEASTLAVIDPYRAATQNKGVMNGIDPVVMATGNDWRAIEAGAHAWAARNGRYSSLTHWETNAEGCLLGAIEIPMALGIVGGASKTHPTAQAALSIMRISSAQELAEVIVAVGLAQNLAALRALATEGIQKGHMALHARNIAILAGAKGQDVNTVAQAIVTEGDVSVSKAKEILGSLFETQQK